MTTYNKPSRIHIQVRDPKDDSSKTRTVYSVSLERVGSWIDGALRARTAKMKMSQTTARVHIQIKDPNKKSKKNSLSKTVYGEKLETVLGIIDRLLSEKVGK